MKDSLKSKLSFCWWIFSLLFQAKAATEADKDDSKIAPETTGHKIPPSNVTPVDPENITKTIKPIIVESTFPIVINFVNVLQSGFWTELIFTI